MLFVSQDFFYPVPEDSFETKFSKILTDKQWIQAVYSRANVGSFYAGIFQFWIFVTMSAQKPLKKEMIIVGTPQFSYGCF